MYFAVAFGGNRNGQCNIPALDGALTYAQVAAGAGHTVLLRSDGTALACGGNAHGQCNLPASGGGLTYEGHSRLLPALVLQASFDGTSMHFVTLGGEELCRIEATATDFLADLRAQLMHEIGSMHSSFDVVLPGGELLSRILSEEQSAVFGATLQRD